MTPAELKALFPNASKSFLEQNAVTSLTRKENAVQGDSAQARGHSGRPYAGKIERKESKNFSITFSGQVTGGKNNYIVTRQGKHIPKKAWSEWRDQKVKEIQSQLPPDWEPISSPTNIRLDYVAGDKRRRDMPAIIDAIFHVLEKAGAVTDDTLLWVSESSRSYDKETPRATVTFLP